MNNNRLDPAEFNRLLSRISEGKLVTDEELDRARRYVAGTQMERALLMSALIKGCKAKQGTIAELTRAIVKLEHRITLMRQVLAKIEEEETPVMTAAEMRDLIDRLNDHLNWMQENAPELPLRRDLEQTILYLETICPPRESVMHIEEADHER